ncbi:MAG: peptidoglycan DD-metalloendopeptidase family protein, partial [Methylobacter sp.]
PQKKPIISTDNGNMLKLNFQWPIRGKVLKSFSQADNKGIDIAGEMGQDVSAAEAGKVVYSGQGLIGYGNLLIIKHNDLYLSAYANNSRLLVAEGYTVEKGEVIAKVGQAGSNKTSLHFEIRKNGKPVNPLSFLPEK